MLWTFPYPNTRGSLELACGSLELVYGSLELACGSLELVYACPMKQSPNPTLAMTAILAVTAIVAVTAIFALSSMRYAAS